MSTIENDKRNQKNTTGADLSTSTGSSDDDNDKKDGPPDLNTPAFEDYKTPVDREQAKIEKKDEAEALGYEPPSYEDHSAQTDQSIAQGNTVDITVETKTEPASEPTTTTNSGPDKPYS
ncbi:MAG: hypothetical protein ACREEM_11900 [Blastocatellia bacterium]